MNVHSCTTIHFPSTDSPVILMRHERVSAFNRFQSCSSLSCLFICIVAQFRLSCSSSPPAGGNTEFGKKSSNLQTQNYSNCACISEPSADGPIARSGPCPQTCRAMIPFLVILFIVTLVVSITQMPLLMVTLR